MPKLSKKNLQILENQAKKFEIKKAKDETSLYKSSWKDEEGLNPFKVVRQFIMDKGLKLYGGLALHEHFKKHDDPLYANYEFPDYDVFSPNAWEHAKELCDILYNLGFAYSYIFFETLFINIKFSFNRSVQQTQKAVGILSIGSI